MFRISHHEVTQQSGRAERTGAEYKLMSTRGDWVTVCRLVGQSQVVELVERGQIQRWVRYSEGERGQQVVWAGNRLKPDRKAWAESWQYLPSKPWQTLKSVLQIHMHSQKRQPSPAYFHCRQWRRWKKLIWKHRLQNPRVSKISKNLEIYWWDEHYHLMFQWCNGEPWLYKPQ